MMSDSILATIPHDITTLSLQNPHNYQLGRDKQLACDLIPLERLITDLKNALQFLGRNSKLNEKRGKTEYKYTQNDLFKHDPMYIDVPAHTTHRLTSDLICTGRDEHQYCVGIHDDLKDEWTAHLTIYGWQKVTMKC